MAALGLILQSLDDILSEFVSLNFQIDSAVVRIESILNGARLIDSTNEDQAWFIKLLESFEILLSLPERRGQVGRPIKHVNMNSVELLLSMNFRATKIAKMFSISIRSLHRKMSAAEISVRQSYSQLSSEELKSTVLEILNEFPNTGFKRMQGYLIRRQIKIPVMRIREIMWEVDPAGVYSRLSRSRVIVRRRYYVQYSNEMWHIDTHLKLKRWGIVIRGGIDGKSRICTYLEAGVENTAQSNLESFLKGVEKYGIPYRCRSDKGGENVLVAQFMIRNRGCGRGSHICGRSVHNQRIERFWGDVQSACLSIYRDVFYTLEDDGCLNIEDEAHKLALQHVFVPRINRALMEFMEGWNHHPISSENNYSPVQLMLMHLPPFTHELTLGELEMEETFPVNEVEDLGRFDQALPILPRQEDLFTQNQIEIMLSTNCLADSHTFGSDIYISMLERMGLV